MNLKTKLATFMFAATLGLAANAAPMGAPVGPLSLPDIAPQGAVIHVNSHGGEQNYACFYTKYNYRGDKRCYGVGKLNTLPKGMDRYFRSVKIYGYARVKMCSRKHLHGKCSWVNGSVREFPAALAHSTYSLGVYMQDGYGDNNGGYGGNSGGGYSSGGSDY